MDKQTSPSQIAAPLVITHNTSSGYLSYFDKPVPFFLTFVHNRQPLKTGSLQRFWQIFDGL